MKKIFLDKLYGKKAHLQSYLKRLEEQRNFPDDKVIIELHRTDIKRTRQDINELDDIISCYIDEHSK